MFKGINNTRKNGGNPIGPWEHNLPSRSLHPTRVPSPSRAPCGCLQSHGSVSSSRAPQVRGESGIQGQLLGQDQGGCLCHLGSKAEFPLNFAPSGTCPSKPGGRQGRAPSTVIFTLEAPARVQGEETEARYDWKGGSGIF